MARVLCAWEFGGDLGHVRRLVPIAVELRAMGHEVAVAFRDSAYLEMARAEGFESFIAPLLRAPRTVSPSPLNFSDVLLNLGFDDRRGLAGALRAWRSFYELMAPDVVVADYAPTGLIAAREAGIPRVTVGSGFSLPVLQDPLPALRPWASIDRGVLRALDDRLLESVRASLGAMAEPAPRHAFELFEAQAHLLCTFPEIDPFGPRQGVEYVGPQGDATSGLDLRWRDTPGKRVFAYLKPRNPRFEAVLSGLRALDAEVLVAAPGMAPDQAQAASTARMLVVGEAVNLDLVLPGASLCVAHAGSGLAARALVAGVPMALLPLQLEQFLIAKRIENAGSAAVVSPEEAAPDFGPWLASLLDRASLREAAARHAEAHRGHSFAAATKRAAERIAAVARA
ncbi:MAG TPA: nucleotide disphospho-sugar-binding domain-containing protein [Usitatibacter sp.]